MKTARKPQIHTTKRKTKILWQLLPRKRDEIHRFGPYFGTGTGTGTEFGKLDPLKKNSSAAQL